MTAVPRDVDGDAGAGRCVYLVVEVDGHLASNGVQNVR